MKNSYIILWPGSRHFAYVVGMSNTHTIRFTVASCARVCLRCIEKCNAFGDKSDNNTINYSHTSHNNNKQNTNKLRTFKPFIYTVLFVILSSKILLHENQQIVINNK